MFLLIIGKLRRIRVSSRNSSPLKPPIYHSCKLNLWPWKNRKHSKSWVALKFWFKCYETYYYLLNIVQVLKNYYAKETKMESKISCLDYLSVFGRTQLITQNCSISEILFKLYIMASITYMKFNLECKFWLISLLSLHYCTFRIETGILVYCLEH